MIDVLIKDQSQVPLAGIHHSAQAPAAALDGLGGRPNIQSGGHPVFGMKRTLSFAHYDGDAVIFINLNGGIYRAIINNGDAALEGRA